MGSGEYDEEMKATELEWQQLLYRCYVVLHACNTSPEQARAVTEVTDGLKLVQNTSQIGLSSSIAFDCQAAGVIVSSGPAISFIFRMHTVCINSCGWKWFHVCHKEILVARIRRTR